ncbi:MAG: hypothetical protein EOP48_32180 [Sphingobacteriales bacterium]|nr:MAG: hypothetical protein EOP48_32180 [Sphingobacteriales bacterium]
MKSWTNEIEAYNINQKPDVFEVLDEYIVKKNLTPDKINKGQIHQELGDLINKLSTITISNRLDKDPQIRFGDIFKAQLPDRTFGYYLCITPQCVCVDASKVENNIFFIKSENVSRDLASALKKIETDYYSIVKDNSENFSLKWGECKPFTLWIRDNHFSKLKARYTYYDLDLGYVTTLKENFAQRIANKAFGYGTSIGIDLPHL